MFAMRASSMIRWYGDTARRSRKLFFIFLKIIGGKYCFVSLFLVPLHCHLKGRPPEWMKGRRAANRYTQRKGSAPYAERLGRRNRAARQKVRRGSKQPEVERTSEKWKEKTALGMGAAFICLCSNVIRERTCNLEWWRILSDENQHPWEPLLHQCCNEHQRRSSHTRKKHLQE